jgi:hypothetical protein
MNKKHNRDQSSQRRRQNFIPRRVRFPVRVYDADGNLKREITHFEDQRPGLYQKFGIKMS